MILTFGGDFVNFGGSLVGFSNIPFDELIVDGVKYETFRCGNYLWSTTYLKYHLSTGSHTHENVEYYLDSALSNVELALSNGWKIPDKVAFDDLFLNRNDFSFIVAGYENGKKEWKYNGERCYMIGKDSNVPYLKYWYITDGSTPTYDEPAIGSAYKDESGQKSRFPLRVCKKVV